MDLRPAGYRNSKAEDKAASLSARYGLPLSEPQLEQLRINGIPEKTRVQTEWGVRVWKDWASERNSKSAMLASIPIDFVEAARIEQLEAYLCYFVTEIRRKNGQEYPPQSLYQLCCSLQRAAHLAGSSSFNLFEDPMLQKFQLTLDAEMKRLSSKGKGVKKQTQPITCEEEKRLWQLGLLGDHSAQALVDTMVFQMSLYFALRSGQEHRRLRYHPSQVTLFEPPGGRGYLVYQEDVSKTNQGGIKHMKKVPKEVVHYSNQSDPSRCFVHLYKEYLRHGPPDWPDSAFYLTPLKVTKGEVWFSRVPLGHNMLQKAIPRLMNAAGYDGYYTNHSLRVSAATRLFAAGVDEQLIMSRTGHSSVNGVRTYKRKVERLQEITSDVLNTGSVDKSIAKPSEEVVEKRCKIVRSCP